MSNEKKEKVSQEQIHGLLFGEKLSWQAIIYDLINSEQLDPWDIDISLLSNKYLEKVREFEEANFFVSSKVLLAASLLLRMKSEILLNEDMKSLDDILFGRKEEGKKYLQERIELEEDVPELIPRTPLPRFRKVSLQELMSALGKAINTETRRIRKVVLGRQHEIEAGIALPRGTINLRDAIRDVYHKLKGLFSNRDDKLAFSEFVSSDEKSDKINNFVPLLHLDNQQKVVLEQESHLSEIQIWLKKLYDKKNAALLKLWEKEAEEGFAEELKEEGVVEERVDEKD